MPSIEFREYARNIQETISALVSTGEAVIISLQIDQRSPLRGFISGVIRFNDGSELHFREFINLMADEPRLTFAYHYQDTDKNLIFRYDNALHRPPLPQPEHKHTPSGVETVPIPTLAQVIDEILRLLSNRPSDEGDESR